jgi:hypothetical protein
VQSNLLCPANCVVLLENFNNSLGGCTHPDLLGLDHTRSRGIPEISISNSLLAVGTLLLRVESAYFRFESLYCLKECPCCGVLVLTGEERVNCLRSVELSESSIETSPYSWYLHCFRISITIQAPNSTTPATSTTTHQNVIIGACFDSQSISSSFAVVSGRLYSWNVCRLRIQDTTPSQGPFFGMVAASSAILTHHCQHGSLDESLSQSETVSCTRNDRSYLCTWKDRFRVSSHIGLNEYRTTHIRKTLPNKMTTKGTIHGTRHFQIRSSGDAVGDRAAHCFRVGRSVALRISNTQRHCMAQARTCRSSAHATAQEFSFSHGRGRDTRWARGRHRLGFRAPYADLRD